MSKQKRHKLLQSLLDASIPASSILPPVETRPQVLPLNDLTWENFERLCVRLVHSEAAVFDCVRYGKQGDEQQGIDILARRWVDGGLEHWAYQCKRYSKFTPLDVTNALDSFKFEAEYFVIFLSSIANSSIRQEIAKHKNTQLWDAEDLSRRLKNYPALVDDFFGKVWRIAFCGDAPRILADNRQESVELLVGIHTNHQEWLHSNMLPITHMPATIFGATPPLNPASTMTATEVATLPPLKETKGMVWSLANLKNREIARLVGCNPEDVQSRALDSWLLYPNRRNWLVELLNKHTRAKYESLGLAFDEKHHRFYFTPENGAARVKSYRAFHRNATRKVAYPYHDKETNELRFWVHHATRLSFVEFDKEFFLRIEPAYAFTKDGVAFLASEDIGPLATRRKSGERNQNVFNHLIFWSEMLADSDGEIRIDCGGQVLHISKMFESARANFGIPSDSAPLAEIAMEEDELDLEMMIEESSDDENE